jgi:hypothetical protein
LFNDNTLRQLSLRRNDCKLMDHNYALSLITCANITDSETGWPFT